MIRRPLNAQFCDAVLAEVKDCTMREKPWPVGVPIQLYQWTGKPYRSKQSDVAVVEVLSVHPVTIRHREFGSLTVEGLPPDLTLFNLWRHEGFTEWEDFAEWFLAMVKPGRSMERQLMRFRLWKPQSLNPSTPQPLLT